jgi:trimethylamine--corrinoid protein Co-methyltransferase
MEVNHVNRPQFRLLPSEKLEKLHGASLRILEKTGVIVDAEEVVELLADAGASVSDGNRIRIPSSLVEEALRSTPKNITLYTRDGEPCIYLDRRHTYFGAIPDCPEILDPYTRERRPCYAADTASLVRLIDYLPNMSWLLTAGWAKGIPAEISDRVSFVQAILNTSKPVGCCIKDVSSLSSMLEVCSIVSGSLETLKTRPFFYCTVEPVTPLVHGRDALEKSLLAAQAGIPNVIYPMPMAGATSPATFAGTLAMANAEILSHLVVVQLKNSGAPVIYGAMPNIMDMTTSIYPYGTPELNLLNACLTELSHYHELPMWGTAGCSDAKVIGAEAGAELMFQCLTSALSGADFVHDTGLMDHATLISPELIVFMDEIIDMVKVFIGGIEINDQTLALNLIDSVGPGGSYIAEDHTLEHFRNFWVPSVMDRSRLAPDLQGESIKHCEDLLNEKTRRILDTHIPDSLPEDITKEIKRIEKSWFRQLGLSHEYPSK